MDDDLLDDFYAKGKKGSNISTRIFIIGVVTVFVYYLIGVVRKYLPSGNVDLLEVSFNVYGALNIMIITINSIILSRLINSAKNNLSKVKAIAMCGLVIFTIEIVYLLIENIFTYSFGHSVNNKDSLISLLILSIYGLLMSFICINKIRGDRVLVPVILLITMLLLLGQVIKYIT